MIYDVYGAIKNRAASGRYVLTEIKAKINTLWIDGELTDDERTELLALAEINQDPTYSPMSRTELELLERISALEQQLAQIVPSE